VPFEKAVYHLSALVQPDDAEVCNQSRAGQKHPRERAVLVVLLCLACARGLLYVCLVPPWGHYDEPTHFEHAWLIASRLSLPQEGDYDQGMRREVASSMLEHRFFRDIRFRPNLMMRDDLVWIGFSELNHPPLYYLLLALPLRLVRHADVCVQLYVARLVSWLLYLLSIWIGYGLTGELVPLGHPLRWIVPGVMALLPAYTDLMTAVNNDVGAVVLFSLFLWGGTRTIARGVSAWRLAWMVGTAALCTWTKNTASIALVLLPVVLALALVKRFWKWWWIAGLAIAVSLVFALFGWGDAASWYRSTLQANATSQRRANSPSGERAIVVQVGPESPESQVLQFVPEQDIEHLRGATLTLGAWMWASQPTKVHSPMLYDGQQSTAQVVQVDVEPTFYAITTTISMDANQVQVILRPWIDAVGEENLAVYYDGVVLTKGARSGVPTFDDTRCLAGMWDGWAFANKVRNGSAERVGPRVRAWIESPMIKYGRRSPSQLLTSLLDWEYTGWVHRITARRLFQGFWARFGWNQTGVPETWYWMLGALTVLGVTGGLVALAKAKREWPRRTVRALGLLMLAGIMLWGNAFLRSLPLRPAHYLSVARYAYPAIVPTVLALVGGWWALTPRRFRRWLPLAAFSTLGALDVASLWAVWTFFYGR
jgi:hypothetical protein